MTKTNHMHRPAIAAIAAVIACPSVPAFAQETNSAQTPTVTPEATVTPPVAPPVVVAPVVTPEATAPVVVSPQAQPVVTPQPVATPVIVPNPTNPVALEVPETKPSAEAKASPKANAKPAAKTVTTTRAQPRVAPVVAAAPAASMAVADAPATAPQSAEPAEPPVTAAPAVEPMPLPTMAPAEATAAPVDSGPVDHGEGNLLPYAAGGLALLGLGAAALMMRRRSPEDALYVEDTYEPVAARIEPDPVVMEPVVDQAVAAAVAAPNLSQRLREPKVFADRVGYHESIVDDGPTPENPFLTRAARLKRARFLDRKAAQQCASGEAAGRAAQLAPQQPKVSYKPFVDA